MGLALMRWIRSPSSVFARLIAGACLSLPLYACEASGSASSLAFQGRVDAKNEQASDLALLDYLADRVGVMRRAAPEASCSPDDPWTLEYAAIREAIETTLGVSDSQDSSGVPLSEQASTAFSNALIEAFPDGAGGMSRDELLRVARGRWEFGAVKTFGAQWHGEDPALPLSDIYRTLLLNDATFARELPADTQRVLAEDLSRSVEKAFSPNRTVRSGDVTFRFTRPASGDACLSFDEASSLGKIFALEQLVLASLATDARKDTHFEPTKCHTFFRVPLSDAGGSNQDKLRIEIGVRAFDKDNALATAYYSADRFVLRSSRGPCIVFPARSGFRNPSNQIRVAIRSHLLRLLSKLVMGSGTLLSGQMRRKPEDCRQDYLE